MCQIFYLSREITKNFGAATNNIASLIFLLSKKGTEGVTVTESFLAEKSGLSIRFVSKAKKTLKDHGYIEIVRKNNWYFKGSTIFINQKFLDAFDDVLDSTAQNDNAERIECEQQRINDVRTDCINDAHGMRLENAQNVNQNAQVASASRKECVPKINNKINKNKINKINISREKNDADEPQHLDDDRSSELSDEIGSSKSHGSETQDQIENVPRDFQKCAYSAQEGTNSLSMSNYTQNINIAPSERCVNVLDGTGDNSTTLKTAQAVKTTKKRQKTEVIYPQSTLDVLKLFQDWKDAHVEIEPRIQGVNLQLEAEAFFDYWSSQDWKRKGKPIKSMAGTVATWLMNSCTRVRGNYKAPANDLELSKEREMYDRICAQKLSFSPSQDQDPILADAEVINDEQKLLGGF